MSVLTVGRTTGRLELRPPWSLAVLDLRRPPEGRTDPPPGDGRHAAPELERWLEHASAQAARLGALDLRSPVPVPGSTPVTGGEHVVPVAVQLPDADATRALGGRLAAALRQGDLVVLSGPLGAGKTTLTQGIGAQLGVSGPVTSPTFVLARTHRGRLPLVHVDAYRLRDAADPDALDLDDLDLDAALESAVTVVEWGEGVVEGLSADRLLVRLDRATGTASGDVRTAQVAAAGSRWAVLDPRGRAR